MALQITDLVSKEAINQLKNLNSELDKLKTTYESTAKNLAINLTVKIDGKEDLANFTKVITTNFNQLSTATQKAKQEQNNFTTAIGQEVKTIKEAQQYNKKLREARNQVNATTEEGKRKIKEYNEQIDKNTKLIKENSDAYTKQKMGIGKYFEGFTKGALIMKAVEGAVGLARKAVNLFKDAIVDAYHNIREFEYANSTLRAVLGASTEQMEMLQQQALLLGRNTKYTAQEVTQLQTELARLGFATEDIHAMSEAVLKFGLVTGGSMADSAALAGAMIRTFGANAEEAERYVSAMTIATNKSALSFGKLQVGLPLVAGATNALGWEIEDVLALYGKLADSGMSASIAATALRNILGNLSKENGTMQRAMGGNIETLEDFVKGLQKLKAEGISLSDTMDEKLGGKRGGVALYNLVEMSDTILELRGNITGVTKEFNEAANVMQDNVKTSVDQLKSAWQDLTLAFYESKGAIKSVIDFFTNAIRGIADSIRTYEQRLARLKEQSMSEGQKSIFSGTDGHDSIAQKINELIDKRTKALMAANKALSEHDARMQASKEVQEQYSSTYANINARMSMYQRQIAAVTKEMNDAVEKQKNTYTNPSYANPVVGGVNVSDNKIQTTIDQYQKKLLELNKLMEYAKSQKESLDKVFTNSVQPKAVADDNFDIEDYTGGGGGGKSAKVETAKTQQEINEIVLQYTRDRVKGQLEVVQKGSAEESHLQEMLLSTETELAKISAEKRYNEDIKAIEDSARLGNVTQEEAESQKAKLHEEYLQTIADLDKKYNYDYASMYVESYAQLLADKRQLRDQQFAEDSANNLAQMNSELSGTTNEKQRVQIVKNYKIKQKQLEADYNEDVRKMTEEGIKAQISMLDYLLADESLNVEMRAKLEKELADIKAKYAKSSANEQIKQAERTEKNEEKLAKQRRQQLSDYLNQASETFSAIASFVSQLYQNEIDSLDDDSDALDEKYDKDVERIEALEEQGAISSEEAEARKRAAKDRTEQQQKELTKKQNELAYKQAVWEKAASAAQTSISTSLAIMKVWAGEGTTASKVIMTAMVAAQGAMQLATILATPIPKYAKGTKGHEGGAAIVGDGGKHEFVMYGSSGWITPATDTLVDLPKGAIVYPDANKVMMQLPMHREDGKQVNVVNDYRDLERKQKQANGYLAVIAHNTRRNSNYSNYRQTIW